MDSVTTGLSILGGRATRVVSTNGLVFLEDLSGSGPTGPPRPEGPPGTVDMSQFYTKTQTNGLLAYKQKLLASTSGSGTVLFNNGLLRRLVAGTIAALSNNSSDDVSTDNAGSSGGIPSTIAEVTSTTIIQKCPRPAISG